MLARKLAGSRSRPVPNPSVLQSRHGLQSAFGFRRSALRSAFTLIELLVAIIIIAILLALLLPALTKTRITAQEAKVIVEIKSLETAIAAFKVKYGVEPPSRISIYLTKQGWDADPTSKGIIKRMWPQFDFRMGGPDDTTTGTAGTHYPSNWNKTQQINCGECLMFFLGGIYDTTVNAPTGFSKNPALPFAPRSAATSREGPFMEFDVARIKDTDNSASNNNMPEYMDSLPDRSDKPFLYFSSYEGKGYKPAELPTGSTLADVYRASSAIPVPTPGTATQSLPAQKPQTFQIISPGIDNDYGNGGVFNSNLNNAGLSNKADYDNLTNFHGGRLSP